MRRRLALLGSVVVTAVVTTGVPSALAQPAAPAPPPPDLPPPPPPPWTTNPLGNPTDLTTPPPPDANGASPEAAPPAQPVVVVDHAQEKRIAELERDVAALKAQVASAPPPDPVLADKLSWLRMFRVSGYLQPQLLWQFYDTNASPNPPGIGANEVTAKANGTTTNGDYFRLRRARLKLEFEPTDYARFVFEIDPTPAGGNANGTGTIAREVEAIGIARWTRDVVTEFGMGIFKLPFGFEVQQSDADRPFIERSWSEQNITPGEFDDGARAYTTFQNRHGAFQLAVVNGQTEGESNFAILPDLNKQKDGVGRLHYDFGPVDVGVSGMFGTGQNIDTTRLLYKTFDRFAVNGEIGLHHSFSRDVGESRLFAEITYAENYDRGVHYAFAVPAIPLNLNASVANLNELGWFVRVEQDLSRWATLGVRWDSYTPDTSLGNDARGTLGVVGVAHFTRGLQYMLEYDHATDNVHQAGTPSPSKHIDTISNVLQVRF